jgi:hypothetical protein
MVTGLLSGSVRASGGDDEQPRGEVQVGPAQEAVVTAMLAHAGTGLRREASPLALTGEELEFIASLGPILGDTPRRIKRFVNTVRLLLSVRPALPGEGPTSPRLTLCLLAAIHDGLPGLALIMFCRPAHQPRHQRAGSAGARTGDPAGVARRPGPRSMAARGRRLPGRPA